MKSLFCKIKNKALVVMLIMLVLIGCCTQIFAAYTDNIKVGDTLKFTGKSWSVYKTEYSARTFNTNNIKRYLNNDSTITVIAKNGNVLKIGDNEYIYYGSSGSKYFLKVSSAPTNSTNASNTNASNTNSSNTNSNTAVNNNQTSNQNNSSNSTISNIRERTSKRVSFLRLLLNLFSKTESYSKNNNTSTSTSTTTSSITIPSEEGPGYKFYYSNLSDKEKKVYRYMYSKKSDLISATEINLEPLSNTLNGLTSDEFFKAMKALQYDHPEFYYILSQNKYSIYKTSKIITKLSFTSKNSSVKQNLDKIDTTVNNLINSANKNFDSDYDKLKYLHDEVINILTYKTNVSLSLDGFLTGKGQCITYALMYKYLLNKLNIDCIYVTGYVPNEGYHAWNQVMINNKWYGVDVCWDDPTGGNLRYTYFLKGKNTFKNRTLDYSYPALNSSNY